MVAYARRCAGSSISMHGSGTSRSGNSRSGSNRSTSNRSTSNRSTSSRSNNTVEHIHGSSIDVTANKTQKQHKTC